MTTNAWEYPPICCHSRPLVSVGWTAMNTAPVAASAATRAMAMTATAAGQ